MEDFDVVLTSQATEDITAVTESAAERRFASATARYSPKNEAYSTYLRDMGCYGLRVTPLLLDELAINAQSCLEKILEINAIVRKYINKNDIIGKVIEIIDSNTNSNYKLSWSSLKEGYDEETLEYAKKLISDFNDTVNLRRLIKNAVVTAYSEGNFICCCRNGTVVNWFPLGVAEISDYDVNGDPVVLINMRELLKRLRKQKKRRFFGKLDEEIKENYPTEIYEAYKAKEHYARLDYRCTGVVRINNQNRKYGLTPVFRALYPALMLEQFDDTDMANARVKARKILVQTMRKELLSEDYNRERFFELQAYNHDTLLQAFSQSMVLVTTDPSVEDIKYVTCDNTEATDSETLNTYRERILSSLGVGFLMSTSSTGASTAAIALNELLKTINSITEQIEFFLQKWYFNMLVSKGFDTQYVPVIKILDSEMLDFESRKSLATTLYTIFNGSLTSSLEILGIDIADEKAKRESENSIGMTEIFSPRATSYTTSGEEGGRPSNDDTESLNKREYDETYNKYGRV